MERVTRVGRWPGRLQGARVVLRRATVADAPVVTSILADPEVVRWWGRHEEEELRGDLRRRDSVIFVIEVDGTSAGILECHEETDPMYRHAGLDIALTTPWQGKGLGADAIRTIARYLFKERGHHRLTIDPALANERAIASYRKVGFQPVGVMRRYERVNKGEWHDGLLMDLLAAEFERPS